jgi:hypothetical protein
MVHVRDGLDSMSIVMQSPGIRRTIRPCQYSVAIVKEVKHASHVHVCVRDGILGSLYSFALTDSKGKTFPVPARGGCFEVF